MNPCRTDSRTRRRLGWSALAVAVLWAASAAANASDVSAGLDLRVKNEIARHQRVLAEYDHDQQSARQKLQADLARCAGDASCERAQQKDYDATLEQLSRLRASEAKEHAEEMALLVCPSENGGIKLDTSWVDESIAKLQCQMKQ